MSHKVSCVLWKDKCPVLLLSMHARPIPPVEVSLSIVLRQQGAVREAVLTSPVLLEYTTYMRSMDVADQLRASYSSQTRSHKWWHRVFWFLVDTSIVNMYVMHLSRCQNTQDLQKPMIHLDFKTRL